jgi:hypothetical protein
MIVGKKPTTPWEASNFDMQLSESKLESMASAPPPPWTWRLMNPGAIIPPLASIVASTVSLPREAAEPTLSIVLSSMRTAPFAITDVGAITGPPVIKVLWAIL